MGPQEPAALQELGAANGKQGETKLWLCRTGQKDGEASLPEQKARSKHTLERAPAPVQASSFRASVATVMCF